MFTKDNNKKKVHNLLKLVKRFNSFYQYFCVLACIIFISSLSQTVKAETIITNTATASFTINGGTTQIKTSSVNLTKDAVVIPADQLTLQKLANKTTAKVGDVITYSLSINNPNNTSLNNVIIEDILPTGISYQTDTATLTKNSVTSLILSSNIASTTNLLKIAIGTIPANTVWKVDYQAKVASHVTLGIAINKAIAKSDTATSTSTQASVTIIKQRTPSTITFLKIDDSGTNTLIPPTAYNDSQTGGKHWQLVNSIKLINGSIVSLPTPQPLIEANQYEISEPIVIEVKDLDQNTDSTKVETIFITIQVPGTNDKEILLLRETGTNTGIFRGIIATTGASSQLQNGVLSLQAGQKITVNYRDSEDSTDTNADVAFVLTDSTLNLSKTADKTTATVGEQVRYTLNFNNTSNSDLTTLSIQDTLPLGVRFITGTARLNNHVLATNNITHNGRFLKFNLSNMPRGEQWQLEYLTKITAGVAYGKITNKAYLSSGQLRSNIARATINIKDDLMRNKAILTGRVYIGCETKNKPKLLKDARIFLETGRNILSDKEGFWHMEGVEVGAHVLQLDIDSLPQGSKPILCENNTRHAKDAKSQFVDLQAGSLWRADFYVTAGHNPSKSTLHSTIKEKVNPAKLYDKAYLEIANSDFEILWPKNNYVPEISSTKIMIKSPYQHRVELFLNGKSVSWLNYEGSDSNKARTAIIRRWTGVDIDIKNRDNTLLVILKDKSGKEVARKTHNIHFSGKITAAEYLAEKSVLIADGKTIPTIAVRIKDEDGLPMRANTHGYFTLKDSRYSVKTQSNNKDDFNLNGDSNGQYKYYIDDGGIAYIKLNPTSLSGEVSLTLQLEEGRKKDIKAWLKPKLREWIMVGIAEGTLAHKTLSGNMQTHKNLDIEGGFNKRGRIAFFTKGRIKGKYLLTAAYDTHKQKRNIKNIEEQHNINPDAWYNIYADNSHSQYDAASSSKLYLKIERDNFYALFGNYRTNLSITELAKYERTLNGIKSEFNGQRYSYNAFASETSNKHHHQEIPGDGTSGLYHLSHDIVVNSETINLETRDRFHSETIVETRTLTRYQDYEIDYDAGTLFFKFPITGRDRSLNPQFIVIDYDSETNNNKSIVIGGRVAVKSNNKKLEVGLSAINIGKNNAKDDSLIALDATYKITPDTKIHAEIAQSKSQLGGHQSANAQIIELEKEIASMKAKIVYRKQDKGFGLGSEGSSSASQVGTKKVGAEISYKINEKIRIKAEISQQENLDNSANNTSNNNKRQLAEVSISHQHKQLELNGGLRHSKEQFDDKTVTNDTVIAGARFTNKGGRVTYRADIEENFNSTSIEERSPDRKVIGVDIKIKNGMSLFAEHELTDNNKVKTQSSRVGVSQSLWKGAKAKTSYTRERTDQGQRDYATLGLSQRIQISKYLNADISIDHAKTIGGAQKRFNKNETPPQGAIRDDYTAFSVGMGSHIKDWSWTGRFEMRDGDLSDKINLNIGLIHRLKNGREVSAKVSYLDSDESNGNSTTNTTLSLGTAWHPSDKDFIFFSRLDLVDKQANKVTGNHAKTHTQKIIHNMHYNRKINKKTQLSLHHGIKHVVDQNKQSKHKATIDTGTLQVRRDINKKWDIGVKAGYLHDWTEKTTQTVAGISAGVTPAKNAWIELGYNFEGFNDDDFDDNSYKNKGAYLSFRYKFNQDSFNGKDLPIRRKNKKEIDRKSITDENYTPQHN